MTTVMFPPPGQKPFLSDVRSYDNAILLTQIVRAPFPKAVEGIAKFPVLEIPSI